MKSHIRVFGLELYLSELNNKSVGYIYSMSRARSNIKPYSAYATQIKPRWSGYSDCLNMVWCFADL